MSGWGIKDNKTASGTISIASNGTLTGSSTQLTTQAAPGDYITVDLTGGSAGAVREWVIKSIASNTSAVVMPANPQVSYTTAYADFVTYGAQTFKLSEKPIFLMGDNTTLSTNVFGVDTNEAAATAAEGKPVAHAGWVLKTTRGARTTYETLVALSKNGASPANMGDREDVEFEDYFITITAQPANSEETTGDPATFTVAASITGSGGTLTYQWQEDSGSGFANITEAGVYTDVTTATLTITDNTGLDGNEYRCVVSATGADSKTSNAATLTEA